MSRHLELLNVRRSMLYVSPAGRDGMAYPLPVVELIEGGDDSGGPFLQWEADYDPQHIQATPGRILHEFCRLSKLSDTKFPDGVLDFARRYGTLELCRHARPWRHDDRPWPTMSHCGWQMIWESPKRESLDIWRRYSQHMTGLLNIAARLQMDTPGFDEDWDAVMAVEHVAAAEWEDRESADARAALRGGNEGVLKLLKSRAERRLEMPLLVDGRAEDPWLADRSIQPGSIAAQKLAISVAAMRWLQYGGVQIAVGWAPDDPYAQPEHLILGLTSALAVGLSASLSGELYVCHWCGLGSRLAEGRQRRPRRNANFACETCGRRAQKSDADRRRYQRMKTQLDAGRGVHSDSQTDSQPSEDNASNAE